MVMFINISAYFPLDCEEILLAGHRSNGVYSVYINDSNSATQVYCDMETNGGGWLVSCKCFTLHF